MYAFIGKQAENGGQAYVICPLVEESEEIEAQSVARVYEELKRGPLKGVEVGLLHGSPWCPAEKEAAMEAFGCGHTKVLVSTTVVEVGVMRPATVMAGGNAERFGLAQLHQMRGRVGRGRSRPTASCRRGPKRPRRPGAAERAAGGDDGFGGGEARPRAQGLGVFLAPASTERFPAQ